MKTYFSHGFDPFGGYITTYLEVVVVPTSSTCYHGTHGTYRRRYLRSSVVIRFPYLHHGQRIFSRQCKAVRSGWCARLIHRPAPLVLLSKKPLPSRAVAAPLSSGAAGASAPRTAALATCAAHELHELRTIGGFNTRSLCFRRGIRNNLTGGQLLHPVLRTPSSPALPARAARHRSVHFCNPPLILCANNRSACMREECRVVTRVVGNLAENKHRMEAGIAPRGNRVHY